MLEVRANWTGAVTGLSVSTFRFDSATDSASEAQSAADAVRAFFVGIGASLPTTITVTIDSTVRVVNAATGLLTGVQVVVPGGGVTGDGGGGFARFAGAVVSWATGAFINGRAIRGRTFVVPLAGAAWDSDGTLIATTVTRLQTAATGLATDPGTSLGIYHAPSGGAPGSIVPVTGATIPDEGAVLTSRRD